MELLIAYEINPKPFRLKLHSVHCYEILNWNETEGIQISPQFVSTSREESTNNACRRPRLRKLLIFRYEY